LDAVIMTLAERGKARCIWAMRVAQPLMAEEAKD